MPPPNPTLKNGAMTLQGDAFLLVLVAVVDGSLNAVAGGGTFLTFPTLVFAGVPPIHANSDNGFRKAPNRGRKDPSFSDDQGLGRSPILAVSPGHKTAKRGKMTAPGDYADTFRALGRFLEMIGGSETTLSDLGDCTDVSWQGKRAHREQRRYHEVDLSALRTTVRMFRGIDGGSPPVTLSELLRTIGRQMDEAGAHDVTVEEVTDGFRIVAQIGGERVTKTYSTADLIDLARSFHADRVAEQTAMQADAKVALGQAALRELRRDLLFRHRSVVARREIAPDEHACDRKAPTRSAAIFPLAVLRPAERIPQAPGLN